MAAYRLTFHPLAKYPGPFIAKLTDGYSVYHAWKRDRHLDLCRLHQRYGQVVRFGPNSLSFSTNTAFQQIYGTKANVQKSSHYTAAGKSVSIFTTIDKTIAASRRRLLSQAFSDAALKELQPYVLDGVQSFCRSLLAANPSAEPAAQQQHRSATWSSPKDIALVTNFMSYDILWSICFGKSFGTFERKEHRYAIDLVNGVSNILYLVAQMPSLHYLRLDVLLFMKQLAKFNRFTRYAKDCLAKRLRLGPPAGRRDFISYLQEAKDPVSGHCLVLGQVQEEVKGFMIVQMSRTSAFYLSSCEVDPR